MTWCVVRVFFLCVRMAITLGALCSKMKKADVSID